ncbi:cytochrome P450 [Cladochytrium replicatum]|nr:cytochrome P450 [Cladochytrium replicatum]
MSAIYASLESAVNIKCFPCLCLLLIDGFHDSQCGSRSRCYPCDPGHLALVNSKRKDPLSGIPSPPNALPFLGHALQFTSAKVPALLLTKWAWEHGPVVRINILGTNTLLISDPEYISVLLRQTDTLLKPLNLIVEALKSVGLGKSVSVNNGTLAQRKVARRLIEQPLVPAQVSEMRESIVAIGLRLLSDLGDGLVLAQLDNRRELEKSQMDFRRMFKKTTFDAMMVLAFDMKYEEYSDLVNFDDMERIMKKINSRAATPISYWKYIKTKSDRETDESVKRVEAFADYILKHAMEKPDRAEAKMIRGFLANQIEADKDKLDYDVLISNVVAVLLGGYDTTADTIYRIFHWLAKEPHVQEKVQMEVDGVLSDLARIEDIATLDPKEAFKYVHGVVRETNRLTPFNIGIGNTVAQDIHLGSLTIPKGTGLIILNNIAVLRSSKFEDKFVFRPERWFDLDSNEELRKKELFAYKPFSAGPHVCPGRHLAITEMIYFVAMVCSEFEVSYKPVPEYVRILAENPVDLPLQIRKRRNQREF